MPEMPPADLLRQRRNNSRGVTAIELRERNMFPSSGMLSARSLRKWLLREQLAVETDGLLYATPLAIEIGAEAFSRPGLRA